ncbi:hypothetical protein PF005_g32321 [Phytophthora fragariae]|uniref:Uncharacterized protein n=1 Tax=Phytophthora fragariae TaxID=53985 RepID=A0A6A3V355_9STRA|nr:hypothetical protein PF005_g32321 [Phytophthora fragariae]
MFSASVTVVAHAASLTAARGRSCPRVSATCTEVANSARSKLREAGEVKWSLLRSRWWHTLQV